MPKRILLADDSITIQKVVELTFSDGDYEVTAVNNGSKAVQKLSELRPDIIMPEKNGYEVCEYVKSHPEFRNIPVVLLTGTFEPFDPDRAEKAGCDAVVTKPFESQSLIHKVEELIAQSKTSASAATRAPAETPSPWAEEAPVTPPTTSPFTSATQGVPALDPGAFGNTNDIFAAAPPAQATTEMPFDTPPSGGGGDVPFGEPSDQFSGETRAFQKMSFDSLSEPAPEAAPQPPAPSPWDEAPAAGSFGDSRPSSMFETPAAPPTFDAPSFGAPSFGAPSFDSAPPAGEADAPFGAPPPAEEFSGQTRAFPRMSFDEMPPASEPPPPPQAPASAQFEPPPPPPAQSFFDAPKPEPSPWDQDAPAFSGETRAFEKMSFDDLSKAATPAAQSEGMPWGAAEPEAAASQPEQPAFGSEPPAFEAEPPAFGGETRAFQKMSFDDAAPAAETSPAPPEASPWDEAPEPVESLWSPQPGQEPVAPEPAAESAPAPFTDESAAFAAPPSPEDLPFAAETTAPPADQPEQAWGSAAAAEAQAEPEEPAVPPSLATDTPSMPIAARGELSEEQVDRIARRVVELMSEQVVRNIAWEVIPDVAEMLVKERIRQLESEA